MNNELQPVLTEDSGGAWRAIKRAAGVILVVVAGWTCLTVGGYILESRAARRELTKQQALVPWVATARSLYEASQDKDVGNAYWFYFEGKADGLASVDTVQVWAGGTQLFAWVPDRPFGLSIGAKRGAVPAARGRGPKPGTGEALRLQAPAGGGQ